MGPLKPIHAIERAKERYGITLQFDDLGALQEQIATRAATFLGYLPRGAECWRVDHNGVGMAAVWSPLAQRIITFRPSWSQRALSHAPKQTEAANA